MKISHFDLSERETEVLPFPHFASTSILPVETSLEVYDWLEKNNLWKLTETTFYEQYEFSLLEIKLPKSVEFITSNNTIQIIKNTFTKEFNIPNFELVDIVAHKLVNNQHIGVHNDFIDEEETHRLVLHFNPNWTESNGGFLMLFNSSNAEDVSKIICPINNTAFGFEISRKSHHAVSKIYDFNRYTIVYTFKRHE